MKKSLVALMLALTLFASLSTCFAATTYSEGLTSKKSGGLWGYVNANGTVIIEYQYDACEDFSLGLAQVTVNNQVGIIRPDGEYLLLPIYQSLEYLGGGFYLAQQDDYYGIVNLVSFTVDGSITNIAYPFQYTYATIGMQGGIEVVSLYQGVAKTVIPKYEFTSLATTFAIDGAQFPLLEGITASFTDVSSTAWYSGWVNISYNLGLMEGTGSNLFAPDNTVTLAELLTLAANLESIYSGDDFHTGSTSSSSAWYQSAVDYCLTTGIISSSILGDMNRAVTRTEVAQILGSTSLADDLPILNASAIVRTLVPDVTTSSTGATEIYNLYATGILAGTDANFSFSPDSYITRAEVATIVSRMARPEQRLSLW